MEQVGASIQRVRSKLSQSKVRKTVSYIAEDGLGVGFVSIRMQLKHLVKKAIATLMSEV
jgi:hypothetical protein